MCFKCRIDEQRLTEKTLRDAMDKVKASPGWEPLTTTKPLSLSEVLDLAFTSTTRAMPEDRPQDLRSDLDDLKDRISSLEGKAERMRLAALLSNGVNTRTVDRVGELGEKSKETDSVLASHNERTDGLMDRLATLEEKVARCTEFMKDPMSAWNRRTDALIEHVKGLEESLKAQGRQLEELLLWRESVLEKDGDAERDEDGLLPEDKA